MAFERRYESLNAPKIEEVLPDYFKTEYPDLIKFLTSYYETLEFDDGTGYTDIINELYDTRDLVGVDKYLFDFLMPELTEGVQIENILTDYRLKAGLLARYYRKKGSFNGMKEFFKWLLNENVEIIYTKENIFRISDPTLKNEVLYITAPSSGKVRFTTEDPIVVKRESVTHELSFITHSVTNPNLFATYDYEENSDSYSISYTFSNLDVMPNYFEINVVDYTDSVPVVIETYYDLNEFLDTRFTFAYGTEIEIEFVYYEHQIDPSSIQLSDNSILLEIDVYNDKGKQIDAQYKVNSALLQVYTYQNVTATIQDFYPVIEEDSFKVYDLELDKRVYPTDIWVNANMKEVILEDISLSNKSLSVTFNYINNSSKESRIGNKSFKYLKDDKLYQTFALLIKTGTNASKWRDMYKQFAHPAGFYFQGYTVIESFYDMKKSDTPINVAIDFIELDPYTSMIDVSSESSVTAIVDDSQLD